MSLVRPFLSPLHLKWQCSSSRQQSSHSMSLPTHKFKANPLYRHLSPTKTLLTTCHFSFPLVNLLELASNVQAMPESTILLTRVIKLLDATKSMPKLMILPQPTRQMPDYTKSTSKFPSDPTKLLSYCYCSPYFFLVKYYYIRIITLLFYY